MTLGDQQDADLAIVLAESGNAFTWLDTEYPCILSTEVAQRPLEEGGFMPDYDMTLTTRRRLIQSPTLPSAGDTVTVAGESRKVIRRRVNFTGAILRLDLQTTAK